MVSEEKYLLANQEILGGLKSALARGQSLKKAMMTFYRAGYNKDEIEKAAKAYLYLQKGVSEVRVLKKEEERKKLKEKKPEANKEKDKFQEIKKKKGIFSFLRKTKVPGAGETPKEVVPKKKTIQKVSKYPTKKEVPKVPGKAITIILIVALGVLLAILASVFLFKDELISFFNNLFS